MSDQRFPDCPFCGSDDLIFDPSFPEDENAVECNGCGAWAQSERKWKARVRPATLLTWSEPDAEGDIKAGSYTVEKSAHWKNTSVPIYQALLPREHIKTCADPEAAKAACEQHARKMLGWSPT